MCDLGTPGKPVELTSENIGAFIRAMRPGGVAPNAQAKVYHPQFGMMTQAEWAQKVREMEEADARAAQREGR